VNLRTPSRRRGFESRHPLLWALACAVIGLIASGLLSGVLHWSRSTFVLGYSLLVGGFTLAYVRASGMDPWLQIRRHRVSGTIGGLLVGYLLASNVYSQPASAPPEGGELITAIVWFGLVYGTADALLLNIIPVLAIYGTRPKEQLRQGALRLRWGAIALLGSLLITAFYHLGFSEFRGPALLQPLIGNAIITAGYLLTGSPLAALMAHVIMHAAAVVHGMETTVQLPPHY
jgi:hypothetical protein